MAKSRHRSWRNVRRRGRPRCLLGRADDHLWNESRNGAPDRVVHPGQGRGRGVRQGAAIHGVSQRRCHARQAGRRRLHRQLHQRTARRFAGGRSHTQGPQSGAGCASAHRAGFTGDQAPSRSGGFSRHFQSGGRGLARVRLLDVPRDERRHRGRGPVFREHQQSQFRRPPRRGRANPVGQSVHRGGERRARPDHRSAGDAVVEPVIRVHSKTAVIPSSNIDTDQIIPARFLTTTTKEGLGLQLFADWRYRADGSPNPDFALNQPEARGAKVLVAGRNFGCGSSREHAPWALLDYGFRAVISTEIADIFRGNSLKNGLLPIVVEEATARWLLDNPGAEVDIDLKATRLTLPTGASVSFPLEAFARHCLLNGIDELGYLRSKLSDVERYEAARSW